jgi:hypothetical protein
LNWSPRGFLAALLLLLAADDAGAQACAEPATTIFNGTPEMGAKDVPTNVVFYYAIPKRLGAPMPGMFQLHSGHGDIRLQSQRRACERLQSEHGRCFRYAA